MMSRRAEAHRVPRAHWECPCGREAPKFPGAAVPVRTTVSLRVPRWPFCGRAYRDDYLKSDG
jgi:hypothetical protein